MTYPLSSDLAFRIPGVLHESSGDENNLCTPGFTSPQKVLRTVDMLRWDTSKHPLIFGTG